ncbi:MAG: GIY-YIG nuclease family protein [Patescibacteria group bacterium]
MISKKDLKNLPSTFGVYIFKRGTEILYVGKSVNIKARVASHIENAKLDKKEWLIVNNSDGLEFITTENELKALVLESELIKKHTPKYNVRWRDNKSYLYIKITVKDELPKVLVSRKEDDQKSLYFGPFSNSVQVRDLISDIRHIVPFCTQPKIGKKACFYSKIHLCDPCPNEVSRIDNNIEYRQKKRVYRNNINRVVRILRGSVNAFLSDLYRDLKKLSGDENYEEAIKIRNKIFRMERLIHYPLTSHDQILKNTMDFKKPLLEILAPYFSGLVDLERIECYDISNLGDRNQTASMVVATNGRIDKSQYRRFRIKDPKLKSDFERLREVITRRMKNKWPEPNLIVVDGGEPQVETALEVLGSLGKKIPLLGIAKNPDRLVIGKAGTKTVRPALNNPGFNLIRLIRDESHRFARKYHLYLRDRDFLA